MVFSVLIVFMPRPLQLLYSCQTRVSAALFHNLFLILINSHHSPFLIASRHRLLSRCQVNSTLGWRLTGIPGYLDSHFLGTSSLISLSLWNGVLGARQLYLEVVIFGHRQFSSGCCIRILRPRICTSCCCLFTSWNVLPPGTRTLTC